MSDEQSEQLQQYWYERGKEDGRNSAVEELRNLVTFAAHPAARNALEQAIAWLTRPPAPGPPDPPPMPFKGVA